jgi:hypothetical protein
VGATAATTTSDGALASGSICTMYRTIASPIIWEATSEARSALRGVDVELADEPAQDLRDEELAQ